MGSDQLTLDNFEAFFHPTTLSRGRDYYYEGNVLNIKATGQRFVAEVEGSSLYTVTIVMDEAGTILQTYCDCPYDLDAHCKHQAAVLYELREQRQGGTEPERNEEAATDRLLQVLQARHKDELISIILSLAGEDASLAEQILFEYVDAADELQTAKRLMQSHIDRVSRRGSVPSNAVDAASEGVRVVVERADRHPNPMLAVQLLLAALDVSMSLEVEDSEDLDDEPEDADCIGEVVSSLQLLAERCKGNSSPAARRKVFGTILAAAKSYHHRQSGGLHDELLMVCIPFCDLPDCRTELEQALRHSLEKYANQQRMDYGEIAIKMALFQIIEQNDGQLAADQFIAENIHQSEFRRMAIERAMATQDYARALDLANDAIQAGMSRSWSALRWTEYAYRAYVAMGDAVNVRRLAKELLLAGESDYYETLRGFYGNEEWPTALAELLEDLEKRPHLRRLYMGILVKENQQDKLMAYCRQHPEEIFSLYPHFGPDCRADVSEIFRSFILSQASTANKRSRYAAVGHWLATFGRACGKDDAARLKRELQAEYARRPAFLEELGAVRL